MTRQEQLKAIKAARKLAARGGAVPDLPSDYTPASDVEANLMIGMFQMLAHRRGLLPDVRVTERLVTARSATISPPATFPPSRIQQLRQALGVSQTLFAQVLGASPGTVRAWEQGEKEPSSMARRFLEVIERAPEVVLSQVYAR